MGRRLTVILAADVVGYSRLMGEDEAGTLAALNDLRKVQFEPLVSSNNGRIIKDMGDGWLVEYPSVLDAANSAIGIQEGINDKSTLTLRVGLHIGDLVHQDQDVFGDGVNVVARLEANGVPGGIVMSGAAYENLDRELSQHFVDTGFHEFKNIARPIQVYQWQGDKAPPIGRITDYLPVPQNPSVAVLPFDNMSNDQEQEYFSDGISEDIITELSRIDRLVVTARNSSFQFRGKSQDIKQVGQELGVKYVLEGSVRKSGNRVRITAQLIEAENGHHVWAERYDRALMDIFEIQDEITAAVASNVDTELHHREQHVARSKLPENLNAWELYQLGLWHLYRYEERDVESAFPVFEKAHMLAPNYAPPLAGMAECRYVQVLFAMTDDPELALKEGLEYGTRAVKCDDSCAYGHYALGRISGVLKRHDVAEIELKKAIELNPNYGMAYNALAVDLAWDGRAEDALQMVDRALQISPRDHSLWGFMAVKSFCHGHLDEFEEAELWARKSMSQRAPGFWADISLLSSLIRQDKMDEAKTVLSGLLEKRDDISIALLKRALPNYDNEYIRRALDDWRRAGIPET